MKIIVLILCIISCQNILPANTNRSNPKRPKKVFVPPLTSIPEANQKTNTESPTSTVLSTSSDSLDQEPTLDQMVNPALNLKYLDTVEVEALFYAVWCFPNPQNPLSFNEVLEKNIHYKINTMRKEKFEAEFTDYYGNKIIYPAKYIVSMESTISNKDKEVFDYFPDFSKKPTLVICQDSYSMLSKLDIQLLILINMLYEMLMENIEKGLTEPWIIKLDKKHYKLFKKFPADIALRLEKYYNVLEKK